MDIKKAIQKLGARLLAEPEAGAITDYEAARRLEVSTPNTSNAWTHVTPALAKYAKSEGKRTIFGKNKEEKAYQALTEKIRLVILGLYGDNLLFPGAKAEECLMALLDSLLTLKSVYPNWTDAYSAGYRVFVEQSDDILIVLQKHQRSVEMQLFGTTD